ncbi:response regulator [Scytonema sp. NUACC21]
MEEGKVIYISHTDKMFDILYRILHRLSEQIPTLSSAINKQVQELFENKLDNSSIQNPEYLAICWLVNQKYITSAEAGILIEQLALEILEPLLSIEEGSYEFIPENFLGEMPRFCHLDLRLLFQECQNRLEQQRNVKPSSAPQQCIQFLKAKARKYQAKIEQKIHRDEQKFTKQESRDLENNSKYTLISDLNEIEHENQSVSQQSADKKVYKVVCIDDSPVIINAVKSFLDEQIFSVIGVNDPLKALMQIIRIKPDIILLDIEMPNLDGYEICSLLRKHSYFQNTPVIMVTGRTGFIDKAKAKIVKSTGYLTKPFTQVDLLKIIFQHIK